MLRKSDRQPPSFCRAKGRAIHEGLNESRARARKDICKSGATELLLVLQVFLLFGGLLLVAKLPRETACLRALRDVAHEAQEAKFGRGDPGKLASSIQKDFAEFRSAYSDECVKPQHHYTCHLPVQLRRDRFLLDAFTVDRRHQ